MEKGGWILVVGIVITTVGGLITAWYTRRSAKDINAVSGFTALTAAQAAELSRLTHRVEDLEIDQTKRRQLARAHERWDHEMVRRLEAFTDEPFPEPPPLDTT